MIIPSKCYSFITVSKKIRPNKDLKNFMYACVDFF